jgi:hypothetical protein
MAVLYLGQLAAVGPASEFDTQSAVELITTGRSERVSNGNGVTSSVPARGRGTEG